MSAVDFSRGHVVVRAVRATLNPIPSVKIEIDPDPKAPDMAVIIPVVNEQENLEILLPLLGEVIRELDIAVDIIVVDGGSNDESRVVAERLNAHVVVQKTGDMVARWWPAVTSPEPLT